MLFWPRGRSSPGGGWFSEWSQGGYGSTGRCARAVQKCPQTQSYLSRMTRGTLVIGPAPWSHQGKGGLCCLFLVRFSFSVSFSVHALGRFAPLSARSDGHKVVQGTLQGAMEARERGPCPRVRVVPGPAFERTWLDGLGGQCPEEGGFWVEGLPKQRRRTHTNSTNNMTKPPRRPQGQSGSGNQVGGLHLPGAAKGRAFKRGRAEQPPPPPAGQEGMPATARCSTARACRNGGHLSPHPPEVLTQARPPAVIQTGARQACRQAIRTGRRPAFDGTKGDHGGP